MAHRYPRLFPLAALHRLNMPAGVAFIERMLRHFHAALPDDRLAAQSFRIFGYYVIGAALDETAGYAAGPSAAEPVTDEFIARECPHLAASAPFLQAVPFRIDVRARIRNAASGHRRPSRDDARERRPRAEARRAAQGVMRRRATRQRRRQPARNPGMRRDRRLCGLVRGRRLGNRRRSRRARRRGDRHVRRDDALGGRIVAAARGGVAALSAP